MSILGSAVLAKYAPVIFLTATPKGIRPNVYQIAHTLIVSAIVAGSAYGAVRSELSDLKEQLSGYRAELKGVVSKVESVAIRQAEAIGNANAIHTEQNRRLDAAEKRR